MLDLIAVLAVCGTAYLIAREGFAALRERSLHVKGLPSKLTLHLDGLPCLPSLPTTLTLQVQQLATPEAPIAPLPDPPQAVLDFVQLESEEFARSALLAEAYEAYEAATQAGSDDSAAWDAALRHLQAITGNQPSE